MTADLETRLRQVLEHDASNAPLVERAPEALRLRVRRRQARSVAVGVAALVAVVAVAFAGLQLMSGDDRFTPTPAEEGQRPVVQRTATIEGITVTSPSDWYLVDYWAVIGRAQEITDAAGRGESVPGSEWIPGLAGVPVLQLTSHDPGLGAPICGSPTGDDPFPSDAVGLYIGLDQFAMRTPSDGPLWPETEPVDEPGCAGGTFVRFGIDRGDQVLRYLMWYGAGPDASDEARTQLETIVADLDVSAHQPEIHLPGTDTPGFVLWAGTSEDGSTWTIEARPSDRNIDLKMVTREADGTYGEGGFADFDVPPKDVDGGFMGIVTEEAERVEFRPADGRPPAVAQLADLPASLGYDADAYYFASGYPTKDDAFNGELVAVMPTRQTLDPAEFPGGVVTDREVIAEGAHPEAGPWTVEVSLVDSGDGLGPMPNLGFMFAEHGGGSGSVQPLEGAVFRGFGTSLGSPDAGGYQAPLDILGPVTLEAARVVFEPTHGEPIEAQLFPIPERFLGPAQAFLVFIDDPAVLHPKGDLVAYAADGRELGRTWAGPTREPAGVTPEIDAVIQDLRAVRDALPSEPGFSALDLVTLADEAGVDVSSGSDPQAGIVSIVVEDDQHAVLLAELPDGQTLCVGVDQAGSFRYGVGAATTYEGCSGGWDGFMLPPDE